MVIFKLISRIDVLIIFDEIAYRWMPQNLSDDKVHGFVQTGNKSLLPEPMLSKFYDDICRH